MKTTFANRLRDLRSEKGLTQGELAAELKMSKSRIGMYELGNREPDFETLEFIADYFNVDMDYLLGLDVPRNRYQGKLVAEGEEMTKVAVNTYTLTTDEEGMLVEYVSLTDEGKAELMKHLQLLKKVYAKEE